MFGSHYFNLTASSPTSSTSAIAATSTTASATASAVVATTTEAAPDVPQSSSNSSGGMSSSTKAGIGVGVGVGMPLIAAIGFCVFLLGRRRTRRNRVPPAYDGHNDQYGPTGPYKSPGVELQEMPGEQIHEMPAQYQGQELQGQGIRAELSARHGQ